MRFAGFKLMLLNSNWLRTYTKTKNLIFFYCLYILMVIILLFKIDKIHSSQLLKHI